MHHDVALVQVRQELDAQPGCLQAAGDDHGHGCRHGQPAETQCRPEQRAVDEADAVDEAVPAVPDRSAEQDRDGGGHEGDRQRHGAQQRDHHGRGHGVKHLALDSRERKDRNVDGGDDADPEERRPDDLARGPADNLEPFLQRQRAGARLLSRP